MLTFVSNKSNAHKYSNHIINPLKNMYRLLNNNAMRI
ncbi:protein of unknown function [Streptococcus thermophilus]|nr:protein of unknown function [Streptococcus thermophilus]CAD0162789.1 protein of unknown function [Streptococcus thermophilus]